MRHIIIIAIAIAIIIIIMNSLILSVRNKQSLLSKSFQLSAQHTASPKVMKIFSHPQTRNQSQVVQNEKLSRKNVETKIFVGGNGTFFHFFEKKLKKIWKKIFKKKSFFTKICFSGLENAYDWFAA